MYLVVVVVIVVVVIIVVVIVVAVAIQIVDDIGRQIHANHDKADEAKS